jgi:hypothetical protein
VPYYAEEDMMRLTLHSPGIAILYAFLLLVVAFIWAGFVANMPRLRNVRGIPFVIHNPVVALPILFAWAMMAFLFARRYLAAAPDPASEGFTLGLVFLGAAVLFDAVIVAGIVGQGLRHFTQLVLWIGYAVLLLIPWWVGISFRG